MKTIFSLFVALLCCMQAIPCSTFFIHHNGQMVFGRNYDWVAGTGLLCTNHRGMVKTSFKVEDGEPIQWVSKYGSLTFNQYGKEFPTGGMNEKGLVVELMWLNETRYPKKDERPAVNVLQWIQYQLDNAATVAEVIASDKLLRITNDGTPLHYLVADAGGHVATIEFLNGRMVVHTGPGLSMTVLTNSTYEESAQYASDALSRNETGDNHSSIGRFVKACDMMRKYKNGDVKALPVNHAFDILDAVSQGDYTKWSIVYDITNKRIFFKTNDVKKVRSVAFADMKLSCQDKQLAFNINQQSKGDISKSFNELTSELNRKILKETAQLSRDKVSISEKTQEASAVYSGGIRCR